MAAKSGTISADYKVKGGKLLRVELRVVGDNDARTIEAIKITGDFFMHPEDAIEQLEAMLSQVPYTPDAVRARVGEFFARDVQVIGAGVEDFVTVIFNARGDF